MYLFSICFCGIFFFPLGADELKDIIVALLLSLVTLRLQLESDVCRLALADVRHHKLRCFSHPCSEGPGV